MPEPVQSRFSKHIIEVPFANAQEKKEMIKFYLKGYAYECDDAFLTSFVNKCKELSARDIENIVYGAKDAAYLRKPAPMLITKKDLENSLKDLLANKKTMEKKTVKESDPSVDRVKGVMWTLIISKALDYGIKGGCKVAEAYGYPCPS